jgi:hypothetical protein
VYELGNIKEHQQKTEVIFLFYSVQSIYKSGIFVEKNSGFTRSTSVLYFWVSCVSRIWVTELLPFLPLCKYNIIGDFILE